MPSVKIPYAVIVDPRKGERCLELDFPQLFAIPTVPRLRISYSIACQWIVNHQIASRVPCSRSTIQSVDAERRIHTTANTPVGNLGRTDGEGIERGWSIQARRAWARL
ncbi:hypothetical protein C8F01DRAFT_1254014 [Mycena amicta]|nr:hypothetical protein C8F01DRAFT_1254014 [Mycena amicta]